MKSKCKSSKVLLAATLAAKKLLNYHQHKELGGGRAVTVWQKDKYEHAFGRQLEAWPRTIHLSIREMVPIVGHLGPFTKQQKKQNTSDDVCTPFAPKMQGIQSTRHDRNPLNSLVLSYFLGVKFCAYPKMPVMLVYWSSCMPSLFRPAGTIDIQSKMVGYMKPIH